jgi:tight adherence protein B
VQLFIIGTFIGVIAIVLGGYWVLVLRTERQSQTRLQKRLKVGAGSGTARRLSLKKDGQQLSSFGPLNRVLLRATTIRSPLERLIEQSDVRMTVGLFVLTSGTLLAGGYFIVAVLTGYRGIAALVGLLVMFGPYVYLRRKRSKRMITFEEQFPEAIELIARALRAGHAFTTGLGMVADEVPAPVGSEFKLLYDRQNFGMPLQEALREFAERVPLLDARFFATAVLTQREAGGNLSEVLDNLARVVRERFKVKRQVRVISAHARMTGFVLVGLPPITAVAMTVASPDNMKMLVTEPLGVKMVIAALILQVTGGMIVKKLTNLEY